MTRIVALVHGYGDFTGGKGNFIRLEPAIRQAGFETHYIALPHGGIKSMENNVTWLAEQIMEIQRKTSEEKIHLVGHSLGGLTIVAYAKLHPEIAELSVDKIIALGAPLRGTKAADKAKYLAPWLYYSTRTIRQMTYESEYVMDLRKRPLPDGLDVHTIAARHDTMYVTPWDSSLFLMGATKHLAAPWDKEVIIDDEVINIIHCHVGHLTMVLKKPVIRAIVNILKTRHLHSIPPD